MRTMFKIRARTLFCLISGMIFMQSCINKEHKKGEDMNKYHLVVLAPAHFHASLLQKYAYKQIDSTVQVFAPEGPGVKSYLQLVDQYNNRSDNPTSWNEEVYTGPDYLQKMLQESPKQNAIVVIAGNNKRKTEFITKSIEAGMNVLADKPMAITTEGFDQLKKAFDTAKKNKVLLYDIMTERYEITNILQKELSHSPKVFGTLKEGTEEDPAVVFESVHHFYKKVSGQPLIRPDWYFDVSQQGEGIVDVTTHLVDLVQWECFPQKLIDYQKDIQMLSAKRWPTRLTPTQFEMVTGEKTYPGFLKREVKDSILSVYANGEMNYTIKGIHAKVTAIWKFQAPEGSGDTFYSLFKGTKANLIIRQGKEQNFKPVLFVEPVKGGDGREWETALKEKIKEIQQRYPGVSLKENKGNWEVVVPEQYEVGHEQHFAQVVQKYLDYLDKGRIPEWEISYMLAKYYTTTAALEMADNQ